MTAQPEHRDEPARVIAANIAYHAALADQYDATQPHFRVENVQRVDAVLKRLSDQTGGGSLLDLGCGTGFVLNIAKKYFRRVVGVDLTAAMLAKVDRSGGQVEVYEADTAALQFPNAAFDVCTAYGFLHHLYDLTPTLREAHRCLRPSGRFYSDQDPNRAYWSLMYSLRNDSTVTGAVDREVRSVLNVEDEVGGATGLSHETIALAEFQKISLGGLDPDSTVATLRTIGFSFADARHEWFLGEGKIIHQQSPSDAEVVRQYLREMLPATRSLFKYISLHATK